MHRKMGFLREFKIYEKIKCSFCILISQYTIWPRKNIISLMSTEGRFWSQAMFAWAYMVSRFNLVPHFLTPWTIAQQAPLTMRFSRQEYWSGLPRPSSGDLPHPGIKPGSSILQVESLPSEPTRKPFWELNGHMQSTQNHVCHCVFCVSSPFY